MTTTDGRQRELWYLIEGTFGFAGLGLVEFCERLDPWHAYGAHCKSLRVCVAAAPLLGAKLRPKIGMTSSAIASGMSR